MEIRGVNRHRAKGNVLKIRLRDLLIDEKMCRKKAKIFLSSPTVNVQKQ